jgi:uncharacterized protein YjcR
MNIVKRERFLSEMRVEEFADMLGVKPATIKLWESREKLSKSFLAGIIFAALYRETIEDLPEVKDLMDTRVLLGKDV